MVALLGLLSAIAIPVYNGYTETARIGQAVKDIKLMDPVIQDYWQDNGFYPVTLAQVGTGGNDPWGNPYQYLRIQGADPGDLRKDKNLVPINADFDLYSMGADGQSVSPLTAKVSRDDIVRANNGAYIGLAEGY